MSDIKIKAAQDYVLSENPDGLSAVVLICEHASSHIPAAFDDLGLSPEARKSHVAWDPGALALATRMSDHLDARLVANGVSRLVYDCNRAPSAPDAMPARSEVFDIPGNADLSQDDRDARVRRVYEPFRDAVQHTIAQVAHPIIVTLHSFTPVYHNTVRSVEIGILHDADTRLADAMLKTAAAHTDATVVRNSPYGPEDGVTHTLKVQAVQAGHPNVMIEIRNDLLETPVQQDAMAKMLSRWLAAACEDAAFLGAVQCRV